MNKQVSIWVSKLLRLIGVLGLLGIERGQRIRGNAQNSLFVALNVRSQIPWPKGCLGSSPSRGTSDVPTISFRSSQMFSEAGSREMSVRSSVLFRGRHVMASLAFGKRSLRLGRGLGQKPHPLIQCEAGPGAGPQVIQKRFPAD